MDWTCAFDLCELQHTVLRCDNRKDRFPDITVEILQESPLLQSLLPELAATMPEGPRYTYLWSARQWVQNDGIQNARRMAMQRKRLARILDKHNVAEAIFRPPHGYMYRSRAKTTQFGKCG